MRTGLITAQESDFLYLEAKKLGWRSSADFTYYLVDKIDEIRLYGEQLDLTLAQTSPIMPEYLYRITRDSEGDIAPYHAIIDFHAGRVSDFLHWLYEDKKLRKIIQNIIHWIRSVRKFQAEKQTKKIKTEDFIFLKIFDAKEEPKKISEKDFVTGFIEVFPILKSSPYFYPLNPNNTIRLVQDPSNSRNFLYDPIRDKFLSNKSLEAIKKGIDNSLSALKSHLFTISREPSNVLFPFMNHDLFALLFEEEPATVFIEDFSQPSIESYHAINNIKQSIADLISDLEKIAKHESFTNYALTSIHFNLETNISFLKYVTVSIPNEHYNEQLPVAPFEHIVELGSYIKDNYFHRLPITYCNIVFDSTKDKTQFAITNK